VLDKLGVDCDIVGLAKRDEELWLPEASVPVRLSRRSEALKVLQFVRDETHRFATSFNQKLRSQDICFPVLEGINGIGSKKASVIMKSFTSLERIAAASTEEIAEKCGLIVELAYAVKMAASLALKDQAAARKRLQSGADKSNSETDDGVNTAQSGTENAEELQMGALLAAEAAVDYNTED
jgi:excinuclease ABC subunit C